MALSPKLHTVFSTTSKVPGAVLHHLHWDPPEQRSWLAFQFTGLMILYIARYSLPLSIVKMAEELSWDKRDCGIVLSAFYFGYVLTQVIGGYLADRFGGDLVQWTTGIVWAICTLSVAYVAQVSFWLVVLVRCLTGMAQGMHYPAFISLIGHKVVEDSRTKFIGIANAGSHLGISTLGFLGSFLLSSHGWQSLFIVVGCSSLVWAVCLRFFSASNHHRTHYKLSDSVQPAASAHPQKLKLNVHPSAFMTSCGAVPWRELLAQPPVIALFCAHFSVCCFLHTLTSWSPTYFKDFFPERVDDAWLYNTTPSLFSAAGSYTGGILSKYLTGLDFDMTHSRKISISISLLGPTISLLVMAYLGRDDANFPIALFFLILATYCYGHSSGGTTVNPTDLAPPFSGALYGMMNTFGAIPGIFAVSLAGYILHATNSWSVVFCSVSIVLLLGLIIYLIYGSGHKLQLTTMPDK